MIRFDNGASLLLDASYSLHTAADELWVVLQGERGGAEVEPELRLSTERHQVMLTSVPQVDHLTFDADDGFRAVIANVAAACLGREAALAPVADGLQVVRMVEAVYASAAALAEVTLAPLPD